MNDQATANGHGRLEELVSEANPRDRHFEGPILEDSDEHAAVTILLSLGNPWAPDSSSGKYLTILPSNGEAMLDGEEGLEAVIVLPAQAAQARTMRFVCKTPNQQGNSVSKKTASASAATHNSEPLGTGSGEEGIAVGNLMCKSSGKALRLS